MIVQILWIDRKLNFDFPAEMFPIIFSLLEGTMQRLQQALLDADNDKCAILTINKMIKANYLTSVYFLKRISNKKILVSFFKLFDK